MTYLDDPTPLFSIHEWMYFCPSMQYTWDENVNTVLLLVLYVGLFLTLYKRNGKYLVATIPILLLIAIGDRLMRPTESPSENEPYPPSKKKERKERFNGRTTQTNPSKVGVDFQVDDAFKRSRTYVPRTTLADADTTAFAKSLYEHTFRPERPQPM